MPKMYVSPLRVLLSLVFMLGFFPARLNAQLIVTPNVGTTALVNSLVGMGMSVSNIVLNCPSNAYGTFSNGNTTNIGLSNGILLTTGSAINAIGPNNSTSAGTCNNTSANDAQLTSLDPLATHDPCILEFDVVPQCNTLQIRFVFGSEEYPEFVSSGFNDAFGFWISGPGPACQSGFYNNTNVATLPNNTTIVSIDNVNQFTNSAYFVPNIAGPTIQYDGFTTVLTRNIALCPCQTYHWKLAIADAGDCVYDSGVFVDFLSCSTALTATASATPSGCSACTGSASVVAVGQGPFTYSWSPSGGNNATTPSNLCPGTYTCTVDDAISCSPAYTVAVTVTASASGVTLSGNQTNISCAGGCNGIATTNIVSGTGPFTYVWSPSGGTSATASGLCAGTYSCTVTDGGGCTATQVFTLTAPPPLTATQSQVNVTCNGGANGSATVVPSGGTSPYYYSWAPSGGTSATATGLSAGTYTCTITDISGCITTASFTITQPTPVIASTSTTPSACTGSNGTATVNASGGQGPYTYVWSPSGGTGSTETGLAPGNYTVTVTSAGGCTVTAVANVGSTGSVSATTSAFTNVTCFGASDGTATASPVGGTAPFTYAWTPSGGNAATATGLSAGTYTCTITDATGCTATSTVTIIEPPALTISGSSTNIACFGNATGTASVTVGGGTTAYLYAWTPSGGNTASATGLIAGTYTCTVTDANGCIITQSFNITEPPQLTISVAGFNVSCFNACDGQVVVIPNGGTPNYTFAWNTGCTTPSCSNVCAGSYTVDVTDANGCIANASTTVTQPTAITTTTSTIDAHCNQSDGSASANANGGSGLLTYQWIGGPASATYNNIPAGTYSVIVTDANGCSDTATAIVNNLNGINVTLVSTTDLTCFNSNDGAILINVTGGSTPYVYAWTPNVSASNAANAIAAGNYTCTVTDANGCIGTVTTVITQPAQLSLTASTSPASVCLGAPSQLNSNAIGGTPAYNYTWNPGNLSGNSQSVSLTATTTYTAYVTDTHGCSDSAVVVVTVNPSPVALISSDVTSGCAPLCVNFSDISIVANPGVINSWSWDFGDNSPLSTSQNPTHCYLSQGSYTVILNIVTTDGCTATITMANYINVFSSPVAAFSASPQPTTVLNPLITFTDLSTNATTWTWSFGDLLNSTSNLQNPTFIYPDPTCYQVVLAVTSSSGNCTDTATGQVCLGPDAALYLPNAFTPNGDGINDVFYPQGSAIDLDHFEMWIFDRWGNQLFYTDDFAKGWDGKVHGHEDICQIDTYVWKVKALDVNGNKYNLIGKVSIVK